MECAAYQRWCSAYLDELLNPEERAQFEHHLSGCVRCRADLEGLRKMLQALRALESPQVPTLLPGIHDRLARTPWWQETAQRFLAPWPASLPLHGLALATTALVAVVCVGLPRLHGGRENPHAPIHVASEPVDRLGAFRERQIDAMGDRAGETEEAVRGESGSLPGDKRIQLASNTSSPLRELSAPGERQMLAGRSKTESDDSGADEMTPRPASQSSHHDESDAAGIARSRQAKTSAVDRDAAFPGDLMASRVPQEGSPTKMPLLPGGAAQGSSRPEAAQDRPSAGGIAELEGSVARSSAETPETNRRPRGTMGAQLDASMENERMVTRASDTPAAPARQSTQEPRTLFQVQWRVQDIPAAVAQVSAWVAGRQGFAVATNDHHLSIKLPGLEVATFLELFSSEPSRPVQATEASTSPQPVWISISLELVSAN